MNLLSMLLSSMLSSSSVNSMSGKTGLSSKQIQKLVALAVPILLKALTNNASSASGATSLLGALMQHTNKRSFADQIAEADTEDGDKIVHHILGDNSDQVVRQLATESGLETDQVNAVLANMAPALMSGVSAASQPQQQPDAMSGLLSMFGGAQPQQLQQEEAPAMDMSALSGILGMIGGAQPQQPQQQGGLGALGSLLGMFSGAAQQEEEPQVADGSDLLSSLLTLMK